MKNNQTTSKLEVIELLRGIAALAVTWFHLTNGNVNFLPDNWLKASGSYGWLGVEVFFAISGFIIPYSLLRSNFQVKSQWKTFLVKRVVRIYPAYLASIFIFIALWQLSILSPNFKGTAYQFNITNFLLHLGFLNEIFQESWINPVFWTLAIEWQYYLLIIFFYPILISNQRIARVSITILSTFLSFCFTQTYLIFNWIPLFNLGIATFQFKTKKVNLTEYILMLICISVISLFSKGFLPTLASLLTSLAIAFIQMPKLQFINFLSQISYSLYLIHVPIGGRIINLGTRIDGNIYIKMLILMLALSASILSAYFMYIFIEKNAQNYFRYCSKSFENKN